MKTRAHHVLIGIFTVSIVAAAVLFGLWLAKGPTGGGFTDYDVIIHETVYGLSEGSTVQYSGVNVGDVVSLSLDPSDPREVQALVRIGKKTPIKRDTEARLAMTGITGTSVIQLGGGTPHSPTLTAITIKGEKHEEKEEKRRIITSMNVTLAPSSVTSRCRKASIAKRSKRASRKAC